MAELVAMRANGKTRTDSDAPVFEVEDGFWDGAEVVTPATRTSIHLRVDSDALEWFRAQGKGHLTPMNAVLGSYVEAHKQDA